MRSGAEVPNGRGGRGHLWAIQIRREIDTLTLARQGHDTSQLMFAVSVEAVAADTGLLQDSQGNAGFAWTPSVYEKKSKNPAAERIKAAGASLGRIMCGGHPDHRAYLAFLEAIYIVTTAQDYDVVARIEKLWDLAATQTDTASMVETLMAPRPGLLRRLVAWLRRLIP